MDLQTKIKLNDCNQMPVLALGVWQSGEDTKQAVLDALEAGYRHIDTAAVYHNEEAVGQAIKESGIPREELFITTKVWNEDIRKGRTRQALEESLERLQLDYVDLYLQHWPVDGMIESYLTMEQLKDEGKIRSIGVSNFMQHHLNDLLKHVHIIPAVSQMEYNPIMQDDALLQFCKENKIVFEAWSPLGSGQCLQMDAIRKISFAHNKSSAQIILRWLLQKGIVILPKSVHKNRIIENSELFDFALSDEEMAVMNSLNENRRTGPDPDNFNF